MTKLDAVIERLKALPQAEQDALAHEIEGLMDKPVSLTPEQWDELARRRANPNPDLLDHAEVADAIAREDEELGRR